MKKSLLTKVRLTGRESKFNVRGGNKVNMKNNIANSSRKEKNINDIEITCKVFDDIDIIKQALERNNFQFVEEFTLDDIYMYNSKTNQFAQTNGKITDTLIIRYVNDQDKKIICKKRVYNMKGFETGTEKLVLKIDDIKIAEKLLNNLGYYRFLRMIDKNYMYENKDYIAYIQVVENLGTFIEIEAKNIENCEIQIQNLIDLVKSLNLKIGTQFDVRKVDLLYELTKKCLQKS